MSLRYVELGELISISKGRKAFQAFDQPTKDAKRYIQINDLRTDEKIMYAIDPSGVEVTPQDLCIAWDGANAGTVGYGISGIIGSTIARLRKIKDNLFFTPYVARFLQSMFKSLNEGTTGATIPHVSKDKLVSLKIPLPPLDEQRRIATILDKADSIRRKRQESISLTEEFLRSVFLDMFGDPVTNPKGWQQTNIGSIAKIQGGLQVTSKRAGNPIEVPYLRVANVYRDRLNLSEIKTMHVTQSELNRVNLIKGDILFVEGHGNPEEIGRSSVWDGSIEPCIHQNHLIRARIKHDIADPIYISAFLNSSGGRRQLFSFGKTTSGLNTISTSNVKNTTVLLPPFSLQKKYRKIVDWNKSAREKMNNYVDLTQQLLGVITQRAFRGEL